MTRATARSAGRALHRETQINNSPLKIEGGVSIQLKQARSYLKARSRLQSNSSG